MAGTVDEERARGSDSGGGVEEVEVRSPRTGEVLYRIRGASDADVAEVYARAWEAFETLRGMPVRARLDEMLKLKRYLLENRERIITRVCEETGKSRMDALLTEIFGSLDLVDYYDKHAEAILADRKVKTPLVLFPKKSRVYYEPVGPVLVIAPWNYPLVLGFQPFVCAFLAGNPVILKPSSYTPLKGVLEEMVEGSGFMRNALQVVYGTRQTGGKLIEAKPRKIHFTGSVGAGKKIMAQAAAHLIPVELELGGKDPMIVFDDVNLERTVSGALWGGFVNGGQTCTSIERLYVQEGVHDAFVASLKEKVGRMKTLVAGDFDEEELEMGCMTAEFQIKTVQAQVNEAREKGAEIVVGGERKPGTRSYAPTIVANADASMAVAHDETFGPVIVLTKFATEAQAIELANRSPFGLSASVWTADLARADRVARALETGNVSINNALATQANSALPFGGVKDSGFGRYKGAEGLHAFCNVKSVLVDKQSGKLELNWYPYGKQKYRLFSRMLDALFSGKRFGLAKAALLGIQLERLGKRRRP